MPQLYFGNHESRRKSVISPLQEEKNDESDSSDDEKNQSND